MASSRWGRILTTLISPRWWFYKLFFSPFSSLLSSCEFWTFFPSCDCLCWIGSWWGICLVHQTEERSTVAADGLFSVMTCLNLLNERERTKGKKKRKYISFSFILLDHLCFCYVSVLGKLMHFYLCWCTGGLKYLKQDGFLDVWCCYHFECSSKLYFTLLLQLEHPPWWWWWRELGCCYHFECIWKSLFHFVVAVKAPLMVNWWREVGRQILYSDTESSWIYPYSLHLWSSSWQSNVKDLGD